MLWDPETVTILSMTVDSKALFLVKLRWTTGDMKLSCLSLLSHHLCGAADKPNTLNHERNNLQANEHSQRYRQYKDGIVEASGQNSLNTASVLIVFNFA